MVGASDFNLTLDKSALLADLEMCGGAQLFRDGMYNPNFWVEMAKDAGMKYISLPQGNPENTILYPSVLDFPKSENLIGPGFKQWITQHQEKKNMRPESLNSYTRFRRSLLISLHLVLPTQNDHLF